MIYYVGLPLLLLLALVEAAVLPLFPIAGLQPNLVLVVLIAWLILRGSGEAFILIPAAGIFLGLVDGAPFGTALLELAPIALLQEVRGSQLSEGGFILTVVFTVVMTFVFHLVYLIVFAVQGDTGSWLIAFSRVIIPTALLNVVVLLPVYWLILLSSQERRRASYV